MNTRQMLLKLSKRFPKRFAKENHDRVGLMTGKLPEQVNKILLCLDCDHEILPLILNEKPDLIITHHPFIYGTRAFILSHDPVKKALCEKLDELNIPVYSMHTNFDCGKGGMNDALADALELHEVKTSEKDSMMRGGKLAHPMDVNEFAKYAKDKLNVDYALLIANGKEVVESVAIIGGGGSRRWQLAKEEGYDIFISGDAPHYVRRDVVLNNYNYLDMPHEIEKIFMPTMKKLLLKLDNSLEIVTVDHEKLPKVIS